MLPRNGCGVVVSENPGGDGEDGRAFGTFFWALCAVSVICTFFLTATLWAIASGLNPTGNRDGESLWLGGGAPVRNALELCSFISTTAGMLVALLAILVARRQLTHLVDQNRQLRTQITLPLYREVVAEWERDDLASARHQIKEISGSGRSLKQIRQDVHDHLLRRRASFINKEPVDEVGRPIEDSYDIYRGLLGKLEELGLLVRKKHIDADDLMNDIGIGIRENLPYLLAHMAWWRETQPNDALYANTIWLYMNAPSYTLFVVPAADVETIIAAGEPVTVVSSLARSGGPA
jgi:hypothetical protein